MGDGHEQAAADVATRKLIRDNAGDNDGGDGGFGDYSVIDGASDGVSDAALDGGDVGGDLDSDNPGVLPPALPPRGGEAVVDTARTGGSSDGSVPKAAVQSRRKYRRNQRRSSTRGGSCMDESCMAGGVRDSAVTARRQQSQSRFAGIRHSLFRKHPQRGGRHGGSSSSKATRPGTRAAAQRRRSSAMNNLQMQRALLGMSFDPGQVEIPGSGCENEDEPIGDITTTITDVTSTTTTGNIPGAAKQHEHRAGAIDFSRLSSAEIDLFRVLLQTGTPARDPRIDPTAHAVDGVPVSQPDRGSAVPDAPAAHHDSSTHNSAAYDADAPRRCPGEEVTRLENSKECSQKEPGSPARIDPRYTWSLDDAVDGGAEGVFCREPSAGADGPPCGGGGDTQQEAGLLTTREHEEDAFEALCQSYGVLTALGFAGPSGDGGATAKATLPPTCMPRPCTAHPCMTQPPPKIRMPRPIPPPTAKKPKTPLRVSLKKPRGLLLAHPDAAEAVC